MGSSPNARPRRYAQCALRASVACSQSSGVDMKLFPEQPQGERFHVVRLDLGDADEIVAAAVAGIARQEKADVVARGLGIRRRGDVGLEMAARLRELDDAAVGGVVVRKHLDGQRVGE